MANWIQVSLTTNGTCPPACFFSRLAAFFSLGVSADCFFDSLLLRWVFDMVVAPARTGRARRRWEMAITALLLPTPQALMRAHYSPMGPRNPFYFGPGLAGTNDK